jgi:hypothetical protein
MKTLLLALSLAATGVSTATAQIYQPAVVNGSILGGIAGAIIGGHNHDRWGEGAIIGAAAGALLGSTVPAPQNVIYAQPPVTVVQTVPTAQVVANAQTVPNAPVVAAPTTSAPQVIYVQQPAQVGYVPAYYGSAPVYYSAPVVSLGFGYAWGGRRVYVGHGFRRW